MKKQMLTLLVAGAMVAGLATTVAADGESLRLVNGKIEVDAALKEAAAKYEEETGVHVEIESMGGGVNIQDELKKQYQGTGMPDIFVCGSDADFGNWDGLLADMSDCAWAADTDAGYVGVDGLVGFPYTTEAIGLAYNADILEKAGIDPASITGPESMRAAFETLDSMKDELGLTAVIGWCTESQNLYFLHYAEMIALFNEYADKDSGFLTSGTYDQQILGFASGKYAFVTQGSWIGATMTTDDAAQYEEAGNFEVGMIPYAFEEGIDTILTNSPSWWAVFQNDNTDAAKAFLDWLATDEGQEILVMKGGFISPFKSCSFVAEDPFAETISAYTAAGKTSAWHWLKNKAGLDQNATGQLYQDYALGSIPDAEAFTQAMTSVIADYYAS